MSISLGSARSSRENSYVLGTEFAHAVRIRKPSDASHRARNAASQAARSASFPIATLVERPEA